MTVQEKYLKIADDVIAAGPYKPDWHSLAAYEAPKWFRNAKFGIFIHWGIFSVPAHNNEWYSRNMYIQDMEEWEWHRKNFGEHTKFGYKDFIPMFTAPKFDPKQWAKLFKKAGAKYVMPVAEHHDGFQMYDSEISDWTSVKMAMKRDVLGELKEAIQEEDMIFCESNHRVEHAFFMGHGCEFDSDIKQPMKLGDFYYPAMPEPDNQDLFSPAPPQDFMEDWLARNVELVEKYRPAMVYFDWWIHNHSFKPYLKKLCAYYYNSADEWGKEVTVNYKHEAFAPTVATFDVERGALTDISPIPWQTDTAIGKRSWGYTKNNEFKSARHIITDLIDIVSKNGMLLLNVGPKADGTITDEETAVLKQLGAWLKLNGEGIYNTTFWKTFGEGKVNNKAGFFQDSSEKKFTNKDFRFTYKNGYIYAFQMRPNGKDAVIKTLKKKNGPDFIIKNITLLSTGEKLEFERSDTKLTVKANSRFSDNYPICFKIEID